MTKPSDANQQLSRRTLISAVCAAAPAIIAVAAAGPAAAQAGQRKMAQRAVAYQPTPRGDQQCSNCTLFEAPNGCRSVAGTVAAEGWCRIYVRGRAAPPAS